MNSPFTQYKQWMIERYGDALFRVPVQLASSCPHGRCTFCSERGAKAQQTQKQTDPFEQAEEAIRFAKRRYRAKTFMLYIQAFTADLTDSKQQKTIGSLLDRFDFEAISIGTRPDCLPTQAVDFLETLKRTTEVWVELGVQTAHDETLKQIHRGHNWTCSKTATLHLAKRGVHVSPHIIIGLPGETSADWKKTADELAKLPISGIKIHNLHIIKQTELAKQFAEHPFPLLNHWEYAEALIDFLRRVPPDLPVMRISTDTPDDERIAPNWHLEKGQFLDYVIQQMTMREISQGDLLHTGKLKPETEKIPVKTDDGSITFFSEDWKEHYHTKQGARLEAQKKFVEPSGLPEKLKTKDVKLLDVCFGLGTNSLEALCAAGPEHHLGITALEMDKRIVRAASKRFPPLETDPADWKKVLNNLLQDSTLHILQSTISLRLGDARRLSQNLPPETVDVVFHDPFSSQHCPELWTVEFFQQLFRVMKPDGILLTYSSARPVRGAMREAGFQIAETEPGHRMGNGTAAARTVEPLSGFAGIAQMNERRAIPYRDEHLCAPSNAILRQRQEAIEPF
jgi:radical SAM protein (TIGR01212 family)